MCLDVGMPILKLITGSLLVMSSLSQIFNFETWWFIQNVNLIFHEAGHVLFMFFGNFLSILGGSLFEIVVPLTVIVHFVAKKQMFSAACTCWWLSTAFLSVAVYASDAQERILPLITNDIATHDWFNILVSLNLLKYDDFVGNIFLTFSLLSVGLSVFLLSKDRDVQNYFSKFKSSSVYE